MIIGLDLSLSTDNTAVTFMWYDQQNEHHYAKNLVFYPKNKETDKTQKERIPYDKWARAGYCQPIGEDTVDYDEMADIIVDICEQYDIQIGSIAYDTKYSYTLLKRLVNELSMEVDPVKIEQDARHLGNAISYLQRIIYEGTFFMPQIH